MGDYISKHSGNTIDEAIDIAIELNKEFGNKQDKIVVVDTQESSLLLQENIMYRVSNTSSLSISLPDGSESDAIEYLCEVKVDVEGFILNLPEDVYWIKNSDTEMKKGNIYQISILNNCIIMGEFNYGI